MNVSRPVYWHEGLFLRPEHLQQQDLYYRNFTIDILRRQDPHFWGVRSLRISRAALNNQVIEVEQCELIFQDGTHVICPDNAIVGSRNISGKWNESGMPMPVWLGVRKIQTGKNNLSQADISGVSAGSGVMAAARYIVPETPTVTYDLFSDDKQAEIFYLDYKLELFTGDEAQAAVDYQLIKIAELHKSGNEVVISRQYMPPVLSVHSSDVLYELLRDVKEKLMSKARELSFFKQDKGLETGKSNSVESSSIIALLVLNRYSQQLHHLLETDAVMPWQIYGMLRQLAGELSTFSTQYNFSGDISDATLPAYAHENMMPCFKGTTSIIYDLLNDITAGPDYAAELLFDGTYYFANIKDCDIRENNSYYLHVSMQGDVNEVTECMHTRAKLSSREHLPLLLAHSLPGLVLEYEDSPPSNLPRSSGSVYFRLQTCGDSWDAVKKGLNTAVYFDVPPENIGISLMVVYGQ
jgi:type VI secretion system protein ImpJ